MSASMHFERLTRSSHHFNDVEQLRGNLKSSIDCFKQKVDFNSYDTFFETYLLRNKPCLLSSEHTQRWKSRTDWVQENGCPNFEFLREHFGQSLVPVANCREEKYSSHTKEEKTFSDFLDYWEKRIKLGNPESMDILYLKDWHFNRNFPQYKAYETPFTFTSDWLNEFWDTRSNTDDYRFVYMGPKGTWTPFHADVFRSFSWSANICGRKKWIFYPPGEEKKLHNKHGHLVYDVDSPELNDKSLYPYYDQDSSQRMEVIQEAGQIIFVPSGWHHQVYNMDDTISINHNWLNGCNVDISWFFIKDSLKQVQKEIEDCKNMEGWIQQCQLILKASCGIDYTEYLEFMDVIAKHRIQRLQLSYSSIRKLSKNKQEQKIDKHFEDQNNKTVKVCSASLDATSDSVSNSNSIHHQNLPADNLCTACDKLTKESDIVTHKTASESMSLENQEETTQMIRDGMDQGEINHCLFDLDCVKYILNDMINTPEFTELGNCLDEAEKLLCLIDDVLIKYNTEKI